jgi:hypothetical protein
MINAEWNKLELHLAQEALRLMLPESFKFLEWCRCMSHQVFLLQVFSVGVFQSEPISRLYSLARFLESSRYWSRIALGWTIMCSSMPIEVIQCQQLPAFADDVVEFMSYMSMWDVYYDWDRDKITKLQQADPTQLGESSAFRPDLEAYFKLCPTTLTGPPRHSCVNPPVCCPEGRRSTNNHFATKGNVWFRRKIQCPATNKWTKQWQSVDWAYALSVLHGPDSQNPGCASELWVIAFSHIKEDQLPTGSTEKDDNNTRCAYRC